MNSPVLRLTSSNQPPLPVEPDDTQTLRRYIGFLYENYRLIAAVALIVALSGILYAFMATPIYKADILIQVDDAGGPGASSGSGSSKNIQGDLSGAFAIGTTTASEIEVLKSRAVIERAVDTMRLCIKVQPKYFPAVGSWLARWRQELSDPGILGYGGYVWGAEEAAVSVFNVPRRMEGRVFVLTAEEGDSYRVTEASHNIVFRGRVGTTAQISSAGGDIELRVDSLAAKPGAQFLLTRSPRMQVIEELQKALILTEKNKQASLFGVGLEGIDPWSTSAILNEIGKEYIRQNVERKSEKARKSLAFLERQLPELKRDMERSEQRYEEARNKHGSVDLDEEAKMIVQQSVVIQNKLIELNQNKVALLVRYEKAYPAVIAVDQQIRELKGQLVALDRRIKALPAVEQEIIGLRREMRANSELYSALLGTSHELRLAASSEVGSARLLDMAAPADRPIKPNRLIVSILSGALGIVLGVFAAFIKKIIYGQISHPREIEQWLGLPVSATIPHSEPERKFRLGARENDREAALLQFTAPSEDAIEGLRRFCSALQSAMDGARNNIIMLGGPSQGVGKSFISANFATVLGASGKKVLLIDGDLRTGHLHRYFGLKREFGLADVIASREQLDRAIHKDVAENLDFVSTGSLPAKPSELLANENLGIVLNKVAALYDFILIDTPPVLAVSDALFVAPHAGTTFAIVRSGVSTVSQIDETIKQFNQAGASVAGIIFNDVKPSWARHDYGSKYLD